MKRLILMRHAKSDWSAGQDDRARPLNGRGRRSATALGEWLRQNGHLPDEVLCSPAERTRETLDRLALKTAARFESALYLAESEVMEQVLKAASGRCVLMVGHNPGIGNFAAELVERPPQHSRFDDYPTCATLVADFDVEAWSDLHLGQGRALDFVVGRDLTD